MIRLKIEVIIWIMSVTDTHDVRVLLSFRIITSHFLLDQCTGFHTTRLHPSYSTLTYPYVFSSVFAHRMLLGKGGMNIP